MNQYLSDKLKVISFFLIVLVVYIHSYNLLMKFGSGNIVANKGFNSFIQDFINDGIARVAVPLFFFISGYLFYLNFNGTKVEFILKFKKRFKTVFIPYLFWSLWGLLVFFTLQLVPLSQVFFTNKYIIDYSFYELLNVIFINPFTYQLWFIRDLIVLIVLSPIIYLLIKYFKYTISVIFLISWLCHINFYILANGALAFFTLGATVSLLKSNILLKVFRKEWIILPIMWLLFILFKTTFYYFDLIGGTLITFLHQLGVVIGVFSIWVLYDIIFINKEITKYKFYKVLSFSFFIFAFHEPTLIILKKAMFFFLGKGELISLIIYITAPLIIITISILIGMIVKSYFSKFYYLITGGR